MAEYQSIYTKDGGCPTDKYLENRGDHTVQNSPSEEGQDDDEKWRIGCVYLGGEIHLGGGREGGETAAEKINLGGRKEWNGMEWNESRGG